MQTFYESLFVVKQENIFLGSAHWLSSFGVLYKELQTNYSLSSTMILQFLHRQGVQDIAWKNHIPLNSVVST